MFDRLDRSRPVRDCSVWLLDVGVTAMAAWIVEVAVRGTDEPNSDDNDVPIADEDPPAEEVCIDKLAA